MLLAQHHFQAQSRYFESAIDFALSSVFTGPCGFVKLELDEDALWNGTASLVLARGVMPDGLPFDLGDTEPLPERRPIGDALGSSAEGQVLCLAVPGFRRRHANCEPRPGSTNGASRYRAEEVDLFDETTGEDRRKVELGVKNFKLVLTSELDEGLVALPVATVRADGSGHYVSDPDFIPTCLQIGGSVRLMTMLRRLIEMMEAKAKAVTRPRSGGGRQLSEIATQELTNYWLLHALYSSLGPLRHHLQSGRAHPKHLYESLIRLAGALCTFSVDARVDDIPRYDHDNPTEVFGQLERQIRLHLDVVIRESYLSVPLSKTASNLHSAPLEDQRALGGHEWVLRISCSARDSTIIDEVRRKVKVSSAEDVMRLVAEQVPGMSIEHLPAPPSKIAPRVGSHYFRLQRQGFAWDLIPARSSVGVYVPDSLPNADVELVVVLA
jgi:type VI secretion system protein ImpJ